MRRYLVVIEEGPKSYGAYAPDLPGCVAVGSSREEVWKSMQEAVKMHLEGLLEDQEPLPVPHSTARYLELTPPLDS